MTVWAEFIWLRDDLLGHSNELLGSKKMLGI
jgi:hypothetical protein